MTHCRKIKHTLSGGSETYACELVGYEPGFGMLRYVVDHERDISGHRLLPGDVFLALVAFRDITEHKVVQSRRLVLKAIQEACL
jgi:hypothetical protein